MSAPSETYEKGLKMRRAVLGDAYVDKALAGGSEPFAKPGQEFITEVCWGGLTRPGLAPKQRSLMNIGILMALNRPAELAAHTRGAINNGVTEEELSEAIRHAMIYIEVPAGLEAYKVAGKVLRGMKESAELN